MQRRILPYFENRVLHRMADLIYAAVAAGDTKATRIFAENQILCEERYESEVGDFESVDDLDVAASAAASANWDIFTQPLPKRFERTINKDPFEIELSNSEDSSSVTSEGSDLESKKVSIHLLIDENLSSSDPKEMAGLIRVQIECNPPPNSENAAKMSSPVIGEKRERSETSEEDVIMEYAGKNLSECVVFTLF